ncbi:MAG: histidinol-phosphate transaminase [Clostridium sp.]|uniref:histidinol-phosphate transaminase n=1 Tax=Clostridium sp. TaxID=1506 RepID=UPI002FC98D48
MESLVKKKVRDLSPYVVLESEGYTKLDANENSENLFKRCFNDFVTKVAEGCINRYPDPSSTTLREKVAKYVGYGDKDNIICGNGSDELICCLISTFMESDDVFLTHGPTFSMYKISNQILGGNFIEVPSDEKFNVNIDGIIKEANSKNAKLIMLCNPNNPTGTIIKREDILRVINETKSIVVVDEAYYEFLGESLCDKAIEMDRVIVLRTLSKAFALAGARCGYLVSSKNIVNQVLKVKPPYNLNSLTQMAGEVILDNRDKVFESIERIKKQRDVMIKDLSEIKGIQVFETGANFVLIKTEKAGTITNLLKDRKIIVREFSGKYLENCIRLTVGFESENKLVIKTIKEVLEGENSRA